MLIGTFTYALPNGVSSNNLKWPGVTLQQLSYLPHINKHYVYPTTCIIQRQTKPVSVIFVMYFGTSSQVSTCVCKKVVRTESTKKKFTHLKKHKNSNYFKLWHMLQWNLHQKTFWNDCNWDSGVYNKNHTEYTRDVNTRVLGYPGPVWPTWVQTRVPWNQRSAQLPRSPSSKHWLPMWPHTGE